MGETNYRIKYRKGDFEIEIEGDKDWVEKEFKELTTKNALSLDEKEIARLSAICDFHSDRAEAHASFFLAFLFGLFAILAIVASTDLPYEILLALPYGILFVGGLWSFANFSLYATYAEGIEKKLETEWISDIMKSKRKENPFLELFHRIKSRVYRHKLIHILIVIVYFVVGLVSFVAVVIQ